MDSKDKKIKRQNKRKAKRKTRLNNLCAPIQAPVADFAACLLSCPSFVSSPESLVLLLSDPGSLTCLSSLLTPISCFLSAPIPASLAVLLPFCVLGQLVLILHLQLLEYSNKFCQISFCAAIQLALQNFFIRFCLFAYCLTKSTANKILIQYSSTLAYLPAIILEKRLTWPLRNADALLQSS